ncbi:hypothetical protein GCM10022389_19560 [Flavobacterium cheonanense]|uniref:N-acetyltransferase domain-containing protein n=1 Tax=Flavobacterium cheonanense TaxID=706183 RepID=A0ABP7VU65_9FLAO
MTSVLFIPRTDRNTKRALINEIAEAVFGTAEQSAFSEEFVPVGGRVPAPKKENFANFLINVPELLWAVQYNEKTIGFILIFNIPDPSSIGFSINSNFANKGIATDAFTLVRHSTLIKYPIFGSTSTRNTIAQHFMLKQGFVQLPQSFNFCGEESFKYRLDLP